MATACASVADIRPWQLGQPREELHHPRRVEQKSFSSRKCRFPWPSLVAAIIFPHTKWLPKITDYRDTAALIDHKNASVLFQAVSGKSSWRFSYRWTQYQWEKIATQHPFIALLARGRENKGCFSAIFFFSVPIFDPTPVQYFIQIPHKIFCCPVSAYDKWWFEQKKKITTFTGKVFSSELPWKVSGMHFYSKCNILLKNKYSIGHIRVMSQLCTLAKGVEAALHACLLCSWPSLLGEFGLSPWDLRLRHQKTEWLGSATNSEVVKRNIPNVTHWHAAAFAGEYVTNGTVDVLVLANEKGTDSD